MIPGATATALGGLAVLHLVWANGSSFPFSSRAELAEAVIGSESVPGPAACAAVAAGLSSAALLVGGRRLVPPRLRRVGVGVVTATLATRGVLGLVGRTDVVSPVSTSARFRRLDRRLFAPLCLALAAGAASTLRES